ncbi:Uncharacterised protein [uncultured archaeon]|nr:Uncharacterised protein [uncultured archaeon]
MTKTDEIIKSIIDQSTTSLRFKEELKNALTSQVNPEGLSKSELKEIVMQAIAITLAKMGIDTPEMLDHLYEVLFAKANKIIDENFRNVALIGLLVSEIERTIVTETQFLENQAREIEFLTFDEAGSLLYNWQIVDDNRTTTCCRNIKARAGKGKSLEELRKIVNEESARYNAGNPHWFIRDWQPHVNCRGRLVVEKM